MSIDQETGQLHDPAQELFHYWQQDEEKMTQEQPQTPDPTHQLNHIAVPCRLAGIPPEGAWDAHRSIVNGRSVLNRWGRFTRYRRKLDTIGFLWHNRDEVDARKALFKSLHLLECYTNEFSPRKRQPLRFKVIRLMSLVVYFATAMGTFSIELRNYLEKIRQTFEVSTETLQRTMEELAASEQVLTPSEASLPEDVKTILRAAVHGHWGPERKKAFLLLQHYHRLSNPDRTDDENRSPFEEMADRACDALLRVIHAQMPDPELSPSESATLNLTMRFHSPTPHRSLQDMIAGL